MSNISNSDTKKQQILRALSAGIPLKYGDLRNITRSANPIKELLDDGLIEKLPMGLYSIPQRDTSWDNFATISTAFPSAVICLASAATYHGLTTQNPHEVWVAFPYNQSIPKSDEMSIRGFRWKDVTMTTGVEDYAIGSVTVKMTNPARTVVDYLRSMNRSGETDVAMEALSNFRGNISEVIKIAKAVGADKLVRPYINAFQGLGRKP